MKHLLGIIFFSFLFILPVGHAYAETSVDIQNNGEGSTSDVHVENSVGQSTTCVNGNCTTTQNGDNKTTVCINGKCETSQDGTIERQEGGAKVKIENSNQKNVKGGVVIITPSPIPDKEGSKSAEASISAKKNPSVSSHSASSGQEQPFNLEEMISNLQRAISQFFSQNK